MHLVRQAVVNKKREKENTSKPTRIAPITLAAAMSIIKSIVANRIVLSTPNKRTESMEHMVRQDIGTCESETAINVTRRKARAIIITLSKNTVGIAITAVI